MEKWVEERPEKGTWDFRTVSGGWCKLRSREVEGKEGDGSVTEMYRVAPLGAGDGGGFMHAADCSAGDPSPGTS